VRRALPLVTRFRTYRCGQQPNATGNGLLLDRLSQHCAIVGELETTAATLRAVTTSTFQLRLGQHATNICAKAKILCE
jgi:hypothetical protein